MTSSSRFPKAPTLFQLMRCKLLQMLTKTYDKIQYMLWMVMTLSLAKIHLARVQTVFQLKMCVLV